MGTQVSHLTFCLPLKPLCLETRFRWGGAEPSMRGALEDGIRRLSR